VLVDWEIESLLVLWMLEGGGRGNEVGMLGYGGKRRKRNKT